MFRFDPSRLAFRLAILAVGTSVPFVAMIFWLIDGGINRVITAAEWEIKGNAFQRPIEHLLDALPRRFIALKQGSTEIGAIDAEIDQAFVDLDRVADLYGDDLHFISNELEERNSGRLRVSLMRERWRTLTSTTLSATGYDRLEGDLRAMMLYTGNSSNLSLDPDLDSASLIDVTLRALPEVQGQVDTINREALETPERGGTEQSNRRALALAALRASAARMERDLQVMLAEDQYFYGMHVPLHVVVAEEGKEVAQTLGTFSQMLDVGKTTSPEELIRAGKAARSACHHFWTTSIDQVDRLLTLRIRAHQAKRAQMLFSTCLMVVFAGFVGWKLGDKLETEQGVDPGSAAVGGEALSEPKAPEVPLLPTNSEWAASPARPIDRVQIDTLPQQKTDWKEY